MAFSSLVSILSIRSTVEPNSRESTELGTFEERKRRWRTVEYTVTGGVSRKRVVKEIYLLMTYLLSRWSVEGDGSRSFVVPGRGDSGCGE